MTYWCESSFEGILTAVFEAFRLKEEPRLRYADGLQQLSLDGAERVVEADPEKAERVWAGIERRLSREVLQDFYTAWLGESPEVPDLVLHAVRSGMRGDGVRVMDRLQDPAIHRLRDLSRKVNGEVHFFLGALRFVRTASGIYHAGYEPDANITELVAPHFAERLSDQPFLIQDLRRGRCAAWDGAELVLAPAPEGLETIAVDADADFARLWQRYFKAIAVEGRINPRLQRGFLPKRYWKHLTEMEGRA